MFAPRPATPSLWIPERSRESRQRGQFIQSQRITEHTHACGSLDRSVESTLLYATMLTHVVQIYADRIIRGKRAEGQ